MGSSEINLSERSSLPMLECMHMPEPGSVLLAAFPNQYTTRQEGNAKSISLRFWQREVKMGACFSSGGRVHHVFPTRSISHRTRKHSSLLPWTVSLLALPVPVSGRLV